MPERPYLTELRLKNFKSVRDQRIPLSALTLVIGGNSSGKSNLVRGLLALTQTVESRSPTLGFLLNGSRINLGMFDDVLRQGTADAAVSVGITVESDLAGAYFYPDELDLDHECFVVDYDCSFAGTDSADPIYSPAKAIKVTVKSQQSDVLAELKLTAPEGPRKQLEMSDVLWRDASPRPSARSMHRVQGRWKIGAEKSTAVAAADIRGLVPQSVFERRDGPAALAEAWMDVWEDIYEAGVPIGRRGAAQSSSLDAFVSLACESIVAWREGPRNVPWNRYVYSRVGEGRFRRKEVGALDRDVVVNRIIEGLPRVRRQYVSRGRHDSVLLRQVGSSLSTEFQAKVRYLGGLRAAPMPAYQPSPQVQAGEIGDEGQYVASALHTLREQPVVNPLDETGDKDVRSLRDAVDYWANRLDLFREVTPHHRGSLGLDIQVTQEGLVNPLDITSVGIGVSQLLPVIVRCLLSEPGEVVILEQPELHLHPAAQQKLADFLLGCALSGRQLIVETHSEHLINRIRLRSAEDGSDDSPIASNVTLIFAERERSSGETVYTATGVNRFGGLDSWPAGFLDSGISDAQKLLAAGLDKKRREEPS